MPLEPWTVRGVMGMEERAREPSVGGRIEEGVEEPLEGLDGVEERSERNCELFMLGAGDCGGRVPYEFWVGEGLRGPCSHSQWSRTSLAKTLVAPCELRVVGFIAHF